MAAIVLCQGGVGPMTIAMLMKNTVEAAVKLLAKPNSRQLPSVVPEPIVDAPGNAAGGEEDATTALEENVVESAAAAVAVEEPTTTAVSAE